MLRDRAEMTKVRRTDSSPFAVGQRRSLARPEPRHDILKEGTIASVIVLALTLGLAGVLSCPDVPPVPS
jgi:hypothetical protein